VTASCGATRKYGSSLLGKMTRRSMSPILP
jgi:hypothetical protein